MSVPAIRITAVNDAAIRSDGRYVLYWMCAQRRTAWNFALDRAVEHCRALELPLLVFEPLRVGYAWASDRIHHFILEGMRDNAAALDAAGVTRVTYVEEKAGAGKGLLARLAADAAVVVTDEFPCFFLPRMVKAAGAALDVKMEAVDGNGLAPLRDADRVFTTAASFRRHLQKTVWPRLREWPDPAPLADAVVQGAEVAPEIASRWAGAWTDVHAKSIADVVDRVGLGGPQAVALTGGRTAALARLDEFMDDRLARYNVDRNQPLNGAASGLSPYLHFGHVGAHEVLARVFDDEGFIAEGHAPKATGSRSGWWGMSPPAEAFIDELITWREVGFNRSFLDPEGYTEFDTLPDWAKETLAEHAKDPREYVYSLEEFAESETHDRIWNAAQTQLRETGVMHNYLRMLWGKKILEWTPDPRTALDVMVELNNRYALDGRDPNSYSGIFWTLGRYDRAWGPERPIFGKVRFMSSASTERKLKLDTYLAEFAPEGQGQLL